MSADPDNVIIVYDPCLSIVDNLVANGVNIDEFVEELRNLQADAIVEELQYIKSISLEPRKTGGVKPPASAAAAASNAAAAGIPGPGLLMMEPAEVENSIRQIVNSLPADPDIGDLTDAITRIDLLAKAADANATSKFRIDTETQLIKLRATLRKIKALHDNKANTRFLIIGLSVVGMAAGAIGLFKPTLIPGTTEEDFPGLVELKTKNCAVAPFTGAITGNLVNQAICLTATLELQKALTEARTMVRTAAGSIFGTSLTMGVTGLMMDPQSESAGKLQSVLLTHIRETANAVAKTFGELSAVQAASAAKSADAAIAMIAVEQTGPSLVQGLGTVAASAAGSGLAGAAAGGPYGAALGAGLGAISGVAQVAAQAQDTRARATAAGVSKLTGTVVAPPPPTAPAVTAAFDQATNTILNATTRLAVQKGNDVLREQSESLGPFIEKLTATLQGEVAKEKIPAELMGPLVTSLAKRAAEFETFKKEIEEAKKKQPQLTLEQIGEFKFKADKLESKLREIEAVSISKINPPKPPSPVTPPSSSSSSSSQSADLAELDEMPFLVYRGGGPETMTEKDRLTFDILLIRGMDPNVVLRAKQRLESGAPSTGGKGQKHTTTYRRRKARGGKSRRRRTYRN